ncbi:MAG TPA: hypothetical protein VKA64_00040 [Gammaproteobacteria bacterium]|nr:hypothetical protein [Gammaproteobacteria bacterium]
MQMDPGSNYELDRAVAPGSTSTGDTNSAAIDHANVPGASFLIDVSDVGTGGTVDAKLQYSDDNSNWNDEPDGNAGNDAAITQMTAVGQARLDVPNPRARYSRVVVTVGNNSVVLGVSYVAGPYNRKMPW